MNRDPLFGIMAEFDTPERLLQAIRRSTEAGYTHLEAYSPFPMEDLPHTSARQAPIAAITLVSALTGMGIGFWMQFHSSVIGYPQSVAGRPFNSWPAFVPVCFELTILFGALAAALSMLLLNGLPRLHHPVFNHPRFDLSAPDRYFLTISATDPRFDAGGVRLFLEANGGQHVREVGHAP